MDQPKYPHDAGAETDDLLGEKAPLNEPTKPRQKLSTFHRRFLLICFVLSSCFMIDRFTKAKPLQRLMGAGGQVNFVEFEDIVPSEKLQWHPCRGSFFCARLTVPMDYNRPLNASKDNPKVHVALLMAPGMHKNPNEYSVAPLLINPGGPGGSGTFFATIAAQRLQNIVGSDQDVIGFDPRGIGATTPRIDCFSNPKITSTPKSPYDFGVVDYMEGFYRRMIWMLAGSEVGFINSTSEALSKLDVRARALGKLCQHRDSLNGEDSIFKHLHTPNVARDMISIIDAWDEWRGSFGPESTPFPRIPEEKETSSSLNYSLETKGKLVYWGFSYGTLLGATFSAMFPERVGRVVLDGVVDGDSYVSPVWEKSIEDTDAIFNSFPKYCHEGKAKCRLYKLGDRVSDIESRFNDVVSSLKKQPLSFVGPMSQYPYVLNIEALRAFFFQALYSPMVYFELIALIIDCIIREDYYTLEGLSPFMQRSAFCEPMAESLYPTDALISIMCGDKRYPLNETTEHIEKRFEEVSKISSFADIWLSLMMGCDGWGIETIDPPMRWGKHPAHREKPINTSFPLLFLSNTYDPVTPLRAGVKMARLFVDAGLIEQKSMGHCSLAAVSLCTLKKVRAYFQDGQVPPAPIKGKDLSDGKWERCEPNETPFNRYENIGLNGMDSERLQHEDMMTASKDIQEAISKHGFFRQDARRSFSQPQNSRCGV